MIVNKNMKKRQGSILTAAGFCTIMIATIFSSKEITMGYSSAFLISGLLMIVMGIFCTAITYYFGFYRPKYRRQHITHHTVGRVVGMSELISCDVRVPLVEYEVGGNRYTVRGPRFSGRSSFPTANSPMGPNGSNIPLQGPLPQVVVCSGSNGIRATRDMAARYPAGRTVDVFYDPDKPKCAFVEREATLPGWAGALLLGSVILVTLIGIGFIAAGVMLG